MTRESTGVDASIPESETWTLRVKSFVLVSVWPRTSSSSSHVGGMSGHDSKCPMLSFLSRLAGPAGGCRSSGWAPVLLARLSLALVGGVVVSFVSRGRRPKFCRYLPLSPETSVPCTRSPESAGHFVKNIMMDQMVGSRRSPGATILGGETPTSSANHRCTVPPTGCVHPDALCVDRWLVLFFLTGSTLRRPWC